MRHSKGQMLYIVPNPRKCFKSRGSGESTWGEGHPGSDKQRLIRILIALRRYQSQSTKSGVIDMIQENGANVPVSPKVGERDFDRVGHDFGWRMA